MTRPLAALATLLLAVVLPVGAAHAGELSPVDPGIAERPPDLPSWLIASRLGRPLDDTARDDAMMGAGLSDLGAVLLRDAPTSPISSDPLTLRSSGEDSTDLRSLLGQGERWHLMSFGANANARPQEVKVTAYGAVAYLPSLSAPRLDGGLGFGPATAPGAAFGLGLDDPEEPVSLGFKGALGGLGLEGGAEYRSVGKRLDRVVTGPASQKDREGTEVWVAQRLGLLRLKVSQSDLSDNVDRDPALPRTSRTQTAVSAQLAPRAWPIFGLTYATGSSERAWLTGEGGTRTIERQTFDSVAGSAYYGGPAVRPLGDLDLQPEPGPRPVRPRHDIALPRPEPHPAPAQHHHGHALGRERGRPLRSTVHELSVRHRLAPAHLHADREPVEPLDSRGLHRVAEQRPHRGRANHERERRPGLRARQDLRRAGDRLGRGRL